MTRPLVQRYDAQDTTAWAVLIGLAAVIPFAATSLWDENWNGLGAFEWFSIAYAAIASVMLGYSLWGWAITKTSAGRSVPYLFLAPVSTGIISLIFLGDHLGASQLIGGALALTGMALARMAARPHDQRAAIILAEEASMAPDRELVPRAVPGP